MSIHADIPAGLTMKPNVDNSHLLRFGDFALDTRSCELWKAGTPVKLQPQPARVLALLVSRPGELVTREEISNEIWGKETFVEFDQNLNFCIRRIREALEDDPDEPRYIETLPRRGYRFIAELGAPPREALGPPKAAQRRSPGSNIRLAGMGLALMVIAAAGLWMLHRLWISSPADGGRVLLAVLPFKNLSGDEGQDYLADGITEEMITHLARLNPVQLGVIARTSAMQYKSTPKGIAQIGKELGVAYILEGSCRQDRQKLRVSVQLIRVSDETHTWAEAYERDAGDLLALETEIARTVADEIRIKLAAAAGGPAGYPVREPDARSYEAYLKGRYYWRKLTKEDLERAVGYFEDALLSRPDYARAYAGLADTYYALSNLHLNPDEAMRNASDAARRALELDPNLADAHCSLALVRFFYEWNWPEADKEFRRAVELDPGSAEIRGWFGVYLAMLGRADEALAELERARRLDPLSLLVNWTMALPLYFSGRYDEGIQWTRRALELDPSFYLAHSGLGSLYESKGEYETAVAQFRRARELSDSPEILAFLGRALALASERDEALRILEELDLQSSQRYVSPYDLALICEGLGEPERAIQWLEQAFQKHAEAMIGLRLDPRMKRLRGDTRFQDLVRRMNLPGYD